MRRTLALLLVLIGLVAPAEAGRSARSPRPGRVTSMDCLGAAEHAYALYVPKAYKPDRPWPILYCFAPDANGTGMVEHFQEIAEELGWIVAGSLSARNGPSEPNDRAWRAMLRDTEVRLTLHGKLRVACGFSGGAWVASRMAFGRPERFVGVILLGQGMDPNVQPDRDHHVAMIMGDQERRLHELEDVKASCGRHGIPGFFETFPGGHRPPPDALLAKALRWHADTWAERYAGCADAAVARLRGAVAKRVDQAEASAAAGKPAHALAALRQVRSGFRPGDLVHHPDLDARIAELEATPEAASETEAWGGLLKIVARDRKLRPKQRRGLVKKYERLAEAHPNTPSADLARARARVLQAP